jgi:hypothetical protein
LGKLDKIINHQLDISRVRATNKIRTLLKKALELSDQAAKFKEATRNLKIDIKNLKGDYLYKRYLIDSSTKVTTDFLPVEEKQINVSGLYQEALTLSPYSVNMIIIKNKPQESANNPETSLTEQSSSSVTAPTK